MLVINIQISSCIILYSVNLSFPCSMATLHRLRLRNGQSNRSQQRSPPRIQNKTTSMHLCRACTANYCCSNINLYAQISPTNKKMTQCVNRNVASKLQSRKTNRAVPVMSERYQILAKSKCVTAIQCYRTAAK